MESRVVLFVYPPLNKETQIGLHSNLLQASTVSPEVSFLYLESFLKKQIEGIRIEYVDFRIEEEARAEMILNAMITEKGIKYVGFSCYSCHYLPVLDLANIIKRIDKDIITIVGGFHPTIQPDDFLFPGTPVDFIIRGEGEISLSEIVKSVKKPPSNPQVINGIPISDLDLLSPISLELLEKYRDRMDFSELPAYFSRGCVFNCTFCLSRENTCNLKQYRILSPSRAREQLAIFASYEPMRIIIQDPLFGANPRWFDALMPILSKKDRPFKVKVEIHVDLLNEHRITELIKNGIDLTIGFESGSPQMLHLMNKTKDPEQYVKNAGKIIKSFYQSGQELLLNVLVGHAGETKNTIDETFTFLNGNAKVFGESRLKFSLFRLYPGTPIFHHTAFFEKMFQTRFYMKNWWYSDLDHSLVPSIIDPSRNLTLFNEIEYVKNDINELYNNVTTQGDFTSITYKLAFLRQVSRINKSYDVLRDRMMIVKNQIPLVNYPRTKSGTSLELTRLQV